MGPVVDLYFESRVYWCSSDHITVIIHSTQMSGHCGKGTLWPGSTVGAETKVDSVDVYMVGSESEVAILIIADVFGWTLPNTRLLADHYARKVQATVYLPDL